MAKEAKDNPKIREELADLSPAELFAKLAARKQNEKLKEASAKKTGMKAEKQADKNIDRKKVVNPAG